MTQTFDVRPGLTLVTTREWVRSFADVQEDWQVEGEDREFRCYDEATRCDDEDEALLRSYDQHIAYYAKCCAEEAHRAVKVTFHVFPLWKQFPAELRQRVMLLADEMNY